MYMCESWDQFTRLAEAQSRELQRVTTENANLYKALDIAYQEMVQEGLSNACPGMQAVYAVLRQKGAGV